MLRFHVVSHVFDIAERTTFAGQIATQVAIQHIWVWHKERLVRARVASHVAGRFTSGPLRGLVVARKGWR
jgi:hypothetical protein